MVILPSTTTSNTQDHLREEEKDLLVTLLVKGSHQICRMSESQDGQANDAGPCSKIKTRRTIPRDTAGQKPTRYKSMNDVTNQSQD